MARCRGSLFDALWVLPWWVGIGVGALGYVAVVFLLPLILRAPLLAPAAKVLRPLGLLVFGICAIAAAASALRSFLISRKFDRQAGLDDIRALSWRQFESIVGEAFRRRGYSVVENAVDVTDVPTCPTCGSEMVGRTAKRGANAGSQFWGCSQYPRCRGTRAV